MLNEIRIEILEPIYKKISYINSTGVVPRIAICAIIFFIAICALRILCNYMKNSYQKTNEKILFDELYDFGYFGLFWKDYRDNCHYLEIMSVTIINRITDDVNKMNEINLERLEMCLIYLNGKYKKSGLSSQESFLISSIAICLAIISMLFKPSVDVKGIYFLIYCSFSLLILSIIVVFTAIVINNALIKNSLYSERQSYIDVYLKIVQNEIERRKELRRRREYLNLRKDRFPYRPYRVNSKREERIK